MYNQNVLEERVAELLKDADSIHNFRHVQKVWEIAKQIADLEKTQVDFEVLHAACLFHDVGYIFLKGNKKTDEHPYKSREVASKVLPEIDFPKEKLELTLRAIELHDANKPWWPNKTFVKEKEIQYLQDADSIEAMGAVGLTRLIVYSTSAGLPIIKEPLSVGPITIPQSIIENVIMHVDYLFGALQSKSAKEIAGPRFKIMKDYVSGFLLEISK